MSATPNSKNQSAGFDSFTTECLNTPFTQWHPNTMAIFASRIEDAFFEKLKGPMAQVHDELDALMRHVLQAAPDVLHPALDNTDGGDVKLRAAYMLGCLSFAHQLAATVAQHRPDDDFYEEFKDEQTKKITACLVTANHTKPELFKATGLAQASLDFKMKKLVQLGITDFRTRFGNGEPAVAEYFLTPAAKQMLQANKPD